MKKFTKVLAGLLTFTMFLTSCTGGDKPAATDKPADGATPTEKTSTDASSSIKYPEDSEEVTLRFSWWGSDSRHEAMQAVIDLYTAKHPNVTIEPEYGAWDGWTQTVITQLSSKSEPDILQINYNYVHSLGKGQSAFYNLSELSEFIDLTNWDKEQLDALTYKGEISAVPHGVTARAMLYNKTLFTENNVAYPATYEDLIAAGAIIGKDNTPTGADNKYVLTNIGKHSTDLFIAQMLYNKTGKVMQNDGKINYTVEDVTAVFDQYLAFEKSGALPAFAQEDPIQNESNPVWTSGRSGSVYEWIGTMDKYLTSFKGGEAKDQIGVAPYITAKAGDTIKVFVKPSLGYSVSKNSENPAVAADFINFMFTDPEAVKALGTNLGVSNNKVTRGIQDSEGMVKGAMKEGFDLLDKYEQVVMDPYFEDENVRGQRYIAIEAFRTEKMSSADAAKEYIEKQQVELDKLYK